MTSRNLILLAGSAVILGGAAWWLNSGKKMNSPSLVGKKILPSFDVGEVAAIDVGGKVKLSAGQQGWVVSTLHNYPADISKIRENLLKLQELKVGQVANGRKIEKPVTIDLQDAKGKSLAALPIGDTHQKKASGQMAMYGGGSYPDGRYVVFADKVVLVKETLDAFDGDPKKWVDARIAAVPSADVASVTFENGKEKVELSRKDGSWTLKGLGPKEELDTSKTYSLDSALSYLDFATVADPAKESTYGFSTGAVYTATLKNGIVYKATVGDKSGSDRYVKLSASYTPSGTNKTEIAANEKTVQEFNAKSGKWVYTISSYSADNLAKTRKDLVKAKEEPKKDEVKKADSKKDEAKKTDSKKEEVKKAETKKAEPKKAEPKKDEPKKAEAKK